MLYSFTTTAYPIAMVTSVRSSRSIRVAAALALAIPAVAAVAYSLVLMARLVTSTPPTSERVVAGPRSGPSVLALPRSASVLPDVPPVRVRTLRVRPDGTFFGTATQVAR